MVQIECHTNTDFSYLVKLRRGISFWYGSFQWNFRGIFPVQLVEDKQNKMVLSNAERCAKYRTENQEKYKLVAAMQQLIQMDKKAGKWNTRGWKNEKNQP